MFRCEPQACLLPSKSLSQTVHWDIFRHNRCGKVHVNKLGYLISKISKCIKLEAVRHLSRECIFFSIFSFL